MNEKLTVVIPAKNEAERIRDCIESVKTGCAAYNPRIIVVDSYSTDRTADISLAAGAEVLRLKTGWVHTPAAGRYTGALRANAEYILFIDADMTLEQGFLEKALYLLDEDRSLAGVAGIGREIYLDAHGSPTGENADLYRRAGPADRVTFLGGAALYRRGYLLEAGNFNPFLRAAEEHELGQRLRLKRYRLISIPEPMIRHYTRTISDWEEFSRKRSAGFYRGIGQAFRCAHAPRFFFELLRYYRQYTFFLALIALTAVFYPAAAFLFVAVILGASLAMRSPAKGCRAVLKWMLMCIEITRGMFTAVPDATRYPSDPETLSGGRVCRLPQTIVCLSPIDWDFLRQRHQILMSGFANQGIRVIYVENMHPAPRVSLGLFARAGKRMLRAAGHIRPREQQENITVITPLVMPFAGRASSLLNRLIFNRILCRRILRLVHNRPLLIWTYCATDTVHDLIGRLCPDSVLYDCVCDASLHPDAPADIVDIETRLVKRSDIVLTDNRLHLQKFKPLNPCTHLVEPGVDEIMFAHAVNAAPGVGVTGYAPAPKLCFFGGINDLRMDFDLIRRVALDRPDWRIILYGPVVKSDISKLKLPNITFAGVVDRCALALRLQEMDVLIMPYRLTGFCSSVFPAKTYECLASGKPVVATPLPELKNLSSFIRCASTPEEFVQKIEDCLSHDTPELRTKRVTVARQNTWDSRLTHIQEILKENLC